MPAKLITPIELVKKDAVLIDEFETTQILISLGDEPYIRVTYDAKDVSGNVLKTYEVDLKTAQFLQYVSSNPDFDNFINRDSYKLGKAKGIIPSDAGVI